MTYEQLKQQKELILLDCISGSTAYNLNVARPAPMWIRKGYSLCLNSSYMVLNGKIR